MGLIVPKSLLMYVTSEAGEHLVLPIYLLWEWQANCTLHVPCHPMARKLRLAREWPKFGPQIAPARGVPNGRHTQFSGHSYNSMILLGLLWHATCYIARLLPNSGP